MDTYSKELIDNALHGIFFYIHTLPMSCEHAQLVDSSTILSECPLLSLNFLNAIVILVSTWLRTEVAESSIPGENLVHHSLNYLFGRFQLTSTGRRRVNDQTTPTSLKSVCTLVL